MIKKQIFRFTILFVLFVLIGLFYNVLMSSLNIQEPPSFVKLEANSSFLSYVPDYTEGPKITADSAILMEVTTGQILYAKNEHFKRSPASTTKIMTAIVALERGNLNDIVTVSSRAAMIGGSSLWLHAGDEISLGDLIRSTLVRSGNDGSFAIGEHISGSITHFTELMTKRAEQLGALNTNFKNTHGLTELGHYSTAYDLAKISRYAMKFPFFSESVASKHATMERLNDEWAQEVKNTNRLLWSFDGADGIKTGTTSDAGYCLVASATRDGRQLISVVLHSDNRWRDSAILLDYGFNNYDLVQLAKQGETISMNNVNNSSSQVQLIAEGDLYTALEIGISSSVKKEIDIYDESLMAPIFKFQRLGQAIFSVEGQNIGYVQLISSEDIKPDTLWKRLFSN